MLVHCYGSKANHSDRLDFWKAEKGGAVRHAATQQLQCEWLSLIKSLCVRKVARREENCC